MLTIDRTLNNIWRVRQPRPIAQRVLVYWAALTLGPVLLGISLTLTSYALTASRGMVAALPGGVALLLNLLEFVLLAVGVAGLFHYVPNTEVRWRHALAGGIFVVGRLRAGQARPDAVSRHDPDLFAGLRRVRDAADLPDLALSRLGHRAARRGHRRLRTEPADACGRAGRIRPGGASNWRWCCCALLQAARARRAARPGLHRMCERMRVDPLQVEPLLEEMVGLDWIGRLDEAGGSRYVLLCDPARTAAAPLVDRTAAGAGARAARLLRSCGVSTGMQPARSARDLQAGCTIRRAAGARRIAASTASGASPISAWPAGSTTVSAPQRVGKRRALAAGGVIWSRRRRRNRPGNCTRAAASRPLR